MGCLPTAAFPTSLPIWYHMVFWRHKQLPLRRKHKGREKALAGIFSCPFYTVQRLGPRRNLRRARRGTGRHGKLAQILLEQNLITWMNCRAQTRQKTFELEGEISHTRLVNKTSWINFFSFFFFALQRDAQFIIEHTAHNDFLLEVRHLW